MRALRHESAAEHTAEVVHHATIVMMPDDGNAPTIPNTQAPTHGPSSPGMPKPPDARYALRALLGKGGMGEVWLAHDTRIDRDIAVKLLRGNSDPEAVARFLREARVQGRLEHPSSVPVHDLGGDDSAPFFAMKRLTGTTLAEVMAAHDQVKWPRRVLLARFVEVCLAIEFAHKRGVIVLQMIANALVLDRQRREQERARELLHVQKWQLQQLVPSSGSRT